MVNFFAQKAGNTRKCMHKYTSLLSIAIILLFVGVAANAIYTFSCQIRTIDEETLSIGYEKSPAADAFLGVKYRIVDTENGAAYVKNETALPICFTVKTGSFDALTKLLSNPNADHDTVKNFIDDNILGRMSTTESSSISGKCHIFGRNEYISGEITTDQGILLATLPYNEGWELYIDGTLQPTYPVAGYLTAANIPQGHHHLELKHKTKALTTGMIITLLGLAGVLAYTCKVHHL